VTPSTDEVLKRLEILHRKLDAEGMYVRANTVWLAIEEITRMTTERTPKAWNGGSLERAMDRALEMQNEGGPAFPVEHTEDGMPWVNPGMSLRDWFAGQALAGYAADPASGNHAYAELAEWAFDAADAMLAARRPPANSE
jgi:hypothetical protein